MWYLIVDFQKENVVSETFRERIKQTIHAGPEHVSSWRRLGLILLSISLVEIWIAAAGTLTATSLLMFAHAVPTTIRTISWTELTIVLPLAMIIASAPVMAPNLGPTLKFLWLKLEDMLGRAIVYTHAATHTFSGWKGQYLRKILTLLGISLVLLFELMMLRWTFGFWSGISRSIGPSSAFPDVLGNPHSLPFSLCLTVAITVALLLLRYTISAKWRAIYSKPSFTEGKLPRAPHSDQRVRVLHASDFHITSNDDEPLTEGGAKFSAAALASIMDAIAKDASDCDAVLFTGDITDTGSADAWERFLASCPPDLQNKTILVPGNHDLNLQDGLLALKAEHPGSSGRRTRQIRMALAMAEVMQDRAYLLDRATDRVVPLNRYIQRHSPTLTCASPSGAQPMLGRQNLDTLWQSLFPMVVPVGPERSGKRLGVLILDSVKPGSVGLTNAFGTLETDSITACSALMSRMADRCDCFIIALHHHVAMPAGGGFRERVQNPGLVLENASVLIDMLAKRGDPTVVFHGHRHKTYTGVADGTEVAIVASPSAAVGAKNTVGQGSWRIADLVCSDTGCWLLDMPRKRSLEDHNKQSSPPICQTARPAQVDGRDELVADVP